MLSLLRAISHIRNVVVMLFYPALFIITLNNNKRIVPLGSGSAILDLDWFLKVHKTVKLLYRYHFSPRYTFICSFYQYFLWDIWISCGQCPALWLSLTPFHSVWISIGPFGSPQLPILPYRSLRWHNLTQLNLCSYA